MIYNQFEYQQSLNTSGALQTFFSKPTVSQLFQPNGFQLSHNSSFSHSQPNQANPYSPTK